MADFSVLSATMSEVRDGKAAPGVKKAKDPLKPKKKKSSVKTNGDAGAKPKKKKSAEGKPKNGDGEKKKQKRVASTEKGTVGKKKKEKAKEPEKPRSISPTTFLGGKVRASGLSNRLGGRINFAALDAARKEEEKINYGKANNNFKQEEKSKIFQALNPQQLWKETAEEKRARQDEDNIMVVDVRGGGGMGVLMAEDSQYERDEFGNIIFKADEDDDDEEDESESDGELADFDDDTMKELHEKRREREREAKERQEQLRKQAAAEKAARETEIERELKEIEMKEAKLSKGKMITDDDVKAVQAKLESELDFGTDGFGFH